jgi:hypothetical protein
MRERRESLRAPQRKDAVEDEESLDAFLPFYRIDVEAGQQLFDSFKLS